ncbi:hypothetical protein N1F89_14785 [Aquibium sp. A9E412]|uniref:hypothetical protein n=1 Tax=Aquibium sp. A9E412 TaxID=2976767 RepID=UPI0025B20229|nr:hypothetical protein [Aquibium sp. A9E412]MDN2567488.1 hypothetical protein [Aquibium sp. A9E412]
MRITEATPGATLRQLPKALLIAALIAAPLTAVGQVRGGETAGIIVGEHEKSSGAGLVIIHSLKRAR